MVRKRSWVRTPSAAGVFYSLNSLFFFSYGFGLFPPQCTSVFVGISFSLGEGGAEMVGWFVGDGAK
jgi:hypothetical protein